MISVAIDGPSGSGKSTVSKSIAQKLRLINVDTGALYRAMAYFFHKNRINYKNEDEVSKYLDKIKINLKYCDYSQKIFLNGEDVTDKIRSNDISMIASYISALPQVRAHLLQIQRNIAQSGNVIMDGRDIGTVVLPKATVKIFLTALPEIRARRRYEQLLPENPNVTYEETLKAINERDFNDTHRKSAPLKCASDAVVFDNSNSSFNETVEQLVNLIEEWIKIEPK